MHIPPVGLGMGIHRTHPLLESTRWFGTQTNIDTCKHAYIHCIHTGTIDWLSIFVVVSLLPPVGWGMIQYAHCLGV